MPAMNTPLNGQSAWIGRSHLFLLTTKQVHLWRRFTADRKPREGTPASRVLAVRGQLLPKGLIRVIEWWSGSAKTRAKQKHYEKS